MSQFLSISLNTFWVVIFRSKLASAPLRLNMTESCHLVFIQSFLNDNYFFKLEIAQHPCDSVKCGSRERCSLDARGVAVCGCGPECEPVVRPVCGSDGHTYDSRCHLDRTSCLDNRDVRIAYTGPCGE